jgi:hypothetical protein
LELKKLSLYFFTLPASWQAFFLVGRQQPIVLVKDPGVLQGCWQAHDCFGFAFGHIVFPFTFPELPVKKHRFGLVPG